MVVSKSLAQVDLEWGQRCLELQRESPHLKPMPPHGGSNTQQIIIVIWNIEYGFSPLALLGYHEVLPSGLLTSPRLRLRCYLFP